MIGRPRPIADICALAHTFNMTNPSWNKGWVLWAGAATVVAVAGYLFVAGSAVVIDETGGVQSAVITNSDGKEQRLHKLGGGYFYVAPELEGEIQVRCRSGERKSWGYVSPGIHSIIRVVGDSPCARLVDG